MHLLVDPSLLTIKLVLFILLYSDLKLFLGLIMELFCTGVLLFYNLNLCYRFISIDSKGVQNTLRSLREDNTLSISFASPENLTIGVIVQNAMLVESSAFVNISVQNIVIENVTEVLSNLQDSVK
jgi:hypothetical protein